VTGNPYAAHNVVFLLSFVLAAAGAYQLVRYLTGSKPAAAVSAVLFAFCPYVFAHTAHIHLMMTAGLPFSLLAFHRLIDRPGWKRSLGLAAALALTGLACGYYGVFAALLIALASVYFFVARRLWKSGAHYVSLALAAGFTLVLLLPFLKPFIDLGQGNRPFRRLQDSNQWSANWQAYLASGGWGDRWMLPWLDHGWSEVLFPGFVLLALAGAGVWAGVSARRRRTIEGTGEAVRPEKSRPTTTETVAFYGATAATCLWLSFGPKAGLYAACYYAFPLFSLLRAPSRFGVLVILALAVLAGVGLANILRRLENRGVGSVPRWLVAAAVGLVAAFELAPAPLPFRDVPPLPAEYRLLATLPRGAVAEMPFFWRRIDLHRHTYYMRYSTAHWQPLINGYSDYFPPDYMEMLEPVRWFPTQEAFDILKRYSARYVLFHLNFYDRNSRAMLLERIAEFSEYLRPLASSPDMTLFEIIAWPDASRTAAGVAGAQSPNASAPAPQPKPRPGR
jgi:hypothetical protein